VRKFALALLAFPLIGAAPAATNWVGTVMQAPNGAYVMGNPKAKVRLVEYLSYTCSHCAHFAEESKLPLRRDYIAKGTVAVEFRNAVRDQFDMTAALLARCGGAARFFGNSDAILAAQSTWLGKAQSFIDANGARLQKLPPNEGLKAVARGVGLDAVMKSRGFTPAQMDACLVNKPNQDRIVAMTNEAWAISKINGTPSFKVNGVALAGAGQWDVVEPAIKTALAVR
jgi:protein-disulfide isomerase